MKKLTTLLFILLSLPFYAQWVEQNPGVSTMLNDVYCISDNIVVVVGEAGVILKTTDGGENWIQKNSGTTGGLMKVQFANANIGYVVGGVDGLLKTIDGGENWLALPAGQSYGDALSCVNENIVFFSGGTSLIKTTDGGATYQTLNSPPLGQTIKNIQFITEQIGYVSTYGGFYKTIDGGTTWAVISNENIVSFLFVNQNIGFIYAMYNTIYKTTDGGTNLSNLGYSNGQVQDLFAFNENLLWEVNYIQTLCNCEYYCITKKDSAEIPENQEISNCFFYNYEAVFNAIYFANQTTGYLVGKLYGDGGGFGPPFSRGVIFKNSTGLNTPLAVNQFDKNNAITIFPNPASDQITISFNQTPTQPFTIEITDALGKQIYSKSFQPQNRITLPTASFSKGIYFLTISGEKKQTQKLIIN